MIVYRNAEDSRVKVACCHRLHLLLEIMSILRHDTLSGIAHFWFSVGKWLRKRDRLFRACGLILGKRN